MNRIIIVTLATLLLGACGKPPDKSVSLAPDVPVDNQHIIQQAVKQLTISCIGLNQRGYDLINWHATQASNGGNPYNFHTETWGWNRWIEVTAEVRPSARDLPQEWNARGQIVKYDLGGSPQPGIDGKTALSQLMCGTLPVSHDPDNPHTFLAVPELKVLDQLK
ncbi:MAG: hypothetical protein ACRESQ_06535 [Gammaproteobacteria bacterium]